MTDLTPPRADPGGQTLSSTIASRLREAISGGRIAPGSRLRLEELRARFGVSLSPLREALSRLSAEGFVLLEGQRGYRVPPVSQGNLEEVTRLRALVEGCALEASIAAGDDGWEGGVVARLYRLNKLGRAGGSEPAVLAWEAAHRDLHHHLISACGMPLLLQFSCTLHDLSDRYRRLFLHEQPVDADVAREHADICDAALRRDAAVACALLRQHIERTGRNILATLQQADAKARRGIPAARGTPGTNGWPNR
jgi:DNA-binding GntR family transcriptional regulator